MGMKIEFENSKNWVYFSKSLKILQNVRTYLILWWIYFLHFFSKEAVRFLEGRR